MNEIPGGTSDRKREYGDGAGIKHVYMTTTKYKALPRGLT